MYELLPLDVGGATIDYSSPDKMLINITSKDSTGTATNSVVTCNLDKTMAMPANFAPLNRRFLARITGYDFLIFAKEMSFNDYVITSTDLSSGGTSLKNYVCTYNSVDDNKNITNVTQTGSGNLNITYVLTYDCK